MNAPVLRAARRPAPDLPQAACWNHPELPPETWMPPRQDHPNTMAAIRVCLGCPELVPCRVAADERREPCGVWGGTYRGPA